MTEIHKSEATKLKADPKVYELYGDIIDKPYAKSLTHPHMSMINRAAQFSPFAALTGFGAAIDETARLTDQMIVLDENKKQELDEKLRFILEVDEARNRMIKFTYFLTDERKSGGAYITKSGQVRKFDTFRKCIELIDKSIIPVEDIIEIEI